jgi:hypothetical protein
MKDKNASLFNFLLKTTGCTPWLPIEHPSAGGFESD